MIRTWQDREAEAAAHRLHRWATVLMIWLTTLIILAGIGSIILIAAGVTSSNSYQIGVGIGSLIGALLSVLPLVVFGLWAQAYAADLRARMAETDNELNELDDDEPVTRPVPSRRPRTSHL